MPSPVPVWSEMLASVDLSSPARPAQVTWGRFLPEPSLLLGPETPEKRQLYALTWLRIRPAWLYLLDTASARVTSLPSQWWRDLLWGPDHHKSTLPTRATQRWQRIKDQFGHIFREQDWNRHGGYADWHGRIVKKVTESMMPRLLWELSECSFRYDLLALDRILVPHRDDPAYEVEREELLARVFPDKSARAPAKLPRGPVGLASGMTFCRVNQLEALRRVIYRWPLPGCNPPSEEISISTPEADVIECERRLVSIYVNTFFTYSGRAPSIPYIPPIQPVRAQRATGERKVNENGAEEEEEVTDWDSSEDSEEADLFH